MNSGVKVEPAEARVFEGPRYVKNRVFVND